MTFSHVEESTSSTASTGKNKSQSEEIDASDGNKEEDEEFENALAAFGLNKKQGRKSHQRDDRKRVKRRKSLPKEESDVDESAMFCQSIEKLQAQGDKITGVLESMERNQA